jgi:hypothetical protein
MRSKGRYPACESSFPTTKEALLPAVDCAVCVQNMLLAAE